MHMLVCQHESRNKWRSETLTTLRTSCEHIDTHINLQEILLECTYAWLNDRSFQPGKFQPYLRRLLEEQSEIGWDQVFCGRFLTEWARIQGRHYRSKGADAKLSRDSWTASVSSTLFGCWASLWKTRCDLIHGQNDQERKKRARKRAIGEFKMLCNASTSVPFTKRNIFPDIAAMLKAPTNIIQDWIAPLHGQMIRQCVAAMACRQGTGTRAIWDHFQSLNLAISPIQAMQSTQTTNSDTQTLLYETEESTTTDESPDLEDARSVQLWTEEESGDEPDGE